MSILKKVKYYIKKKIVFRNIKRGKKICILNIEDSINELLNNSKGLVRFGDGELSIMEGGHINFQTPNRELGKKLEEVILNPINNCYIGVPDEINLIDFSRQTERSQKFWVQHVYKERDNWMRYLKNDQIYLTTNVTRPYMRFANKEKSKKYFDEIRKLWDEKDIVMIEGAGTRLGIGNDLFSNCKSIRRIICPERDAFNVYEDILKEAMKLEKHTPVFLALGPTATILGYELCKAGYLAYDIGHIDIEYEWMQMGATSKVAINNKYTNEAENGSEISECLDTKYNEQIIAHIKPV